MRREDQPITGDVSFTWPTLPSTTTIIVVGAIGVGLLLLLTYQAAKTGVKFVGDHPEVIKYAMMA
jgi:hypothetical protein